jgi:osomolarity two-component system, sensor histidine kinase SLN1
MGRMMQRLGCIVSSAENGAVALDMLLAHAESPSGSEDGIDPRSSAPENYDITFLDNQVS